MNVQVLKQTNVTQTPCVTTLKDRLSAAVWKVLRAMGETAQVNFVKEALSRIFSISYIFVSRGTYNSFLFLFFFIGGLDCNRGVRGCNNT